MATHQAVAVVSLAMLLLLCSPGLIASRSLAQDACAKCNIPEGQGGCKCDANCACIGGGGQPAAGGGGGGKCDKCNLPESAGGCKCDANCDCPAGGGQPAAGGGGGKCDKCNLPESAGGCKCDANCDCPAGGGGQPAPGGGGGKCDKCNLPESAGGCKCDANCDCPAGGGTAPLPPLPVTPPAEVPTAPVNRVTCGGGGGCPEKDVRCMRAVGSIDVSSSSTTGCSLGAGASKAGVTIDGKCYQDIVKEERGSFVVMGYVCMGQCYNLFQGGCRIENCNKGTMAARCDEYVPQCKGLCEGMQL